MVKLGKNLVLAITLAWVTPSLAYAGLSFLRGELNAQAGKSIPAHGAFPFLQSYTFTPDEGGNYAFQAEAVFLNRFAVGMEYRANNFENWILNADCFKEWFPYDESLHNWQWNARLYGSYMKIMPLRGRMYEIYVKGGFLVGHLEGRGEYFISPDVDRNPPKFLEHIKWTTNNHWGFGYGFGFTANITRVVGFLGEVQWSRLLVKNEALYPIIQGTDIPVYCSSCILPTYVSEVTLEPNLFVNHLEWADLRFGLVFFIGR
jgi:hypothetical protein